MHRFEVISIVREICKTIIVLVLIAGPMLATILTGNGRYLWWYFLAVPVLAFVLSHFEDLYKEDIKGAVRFEMYSDLIKKLEEQGDGKTTE